ncbi:MAG: chemotaxis protein CheB, partial [Sphingobacterium sp.]
PAGYHLLIEPDYSFSLDISEPVQYSRPSIDVTFESAAEVYKENCTAILFSGANQDGAEGLLMIKKYGGSTFVQDPLDAEVPIMPKAAIELNAQDKILTIAEIKDYIMQLT